MLFRFCLIWFAIFSLSACGNTVSGVWNDTIGLMNKTDWSLFGGKKKEIGIISLQTTTCPPVYLVPDLAQIVQFQNQRLISQTKITGLDRRCEETSNAVRVVITLEATGQLGEQGKKDAKVQANYTFPYLLAVVDGAGNIIAKDVFALNAVYEKNIVTARFRDQIVQTIPRISGRDIGTYHIQLGFQLSPEELAYNRYRR
jgi:hypothetical protein